MKIIHFMDTFGAGGIEANFITVMKNWDHHHYSFELLCLNKVSTCYDEILTEKNIPMIVLMKRQANPIIRYIKSLGKLYKYLKCQDKHTAIHFHISHGVDYLYVWVSKLAGITIRISHCHSSGVNSRYKYIGHIVSKKLFVLTPTHYLSCSIKGAKWLYTEDIVKNKTHIIPNAVVMRRFEYDPQLRNEIRTRLDIQSDITLISTARLTAEKNHVFMLKVISELKNRGLDIVLLLIGDGILKNEILEIIKQLDLENNVRMLGFREDVSSILNAGDIYISTSKYEGLPIAAIEAQANGMYCILSTGVSQEAKITEHVKFIDLEYDVSVWVEEIQKLNFEYDRISDNVLCQNSPYDYRNAIQAWKDAYQEIFGKDKQ